MAWTNGLVLRVQLPERRSGTIRRGTIRRGIIGREAGGP